MRRPNFVMMMADDMGYGDFGVFSEGRVRTPFLDSLIGESVCLSQNYTGRSSMLAFAGSNAYREVSDTHRRGYASGDSRL